MTAFFIVVLLASLGTCTATTGSTGCPCVTVTVNQTAAAGKPDFVTGINYGYGCAQHDNPTTYTQPPGATVNNSCIAHVAAGTTGNGQAGDWCLDSWCIVDPNNCNLKFRAVTFTAQTTDYFSYKTCDTSFAGNGWVGTAACFDNANSFCTSSENTAMRGDTACPCLAPPTATQVKVSGKPDFVNGIHYGYTCKSHDDPLTWGTEPASPTTANSCVASTSTATGQADDWCLDKWCIVDTGNCAYNTRAVTFTADANDYFSYRTCEGNTFAGNGWVGRAACVHQTDSFCTASENTAMGGHADCPCVTPARTQTKVAGKPDFVDNTTYGYFCRAHDKPSTYDNEPTSPTTANSCVTANNTADGQDNDWCLDKWCIVNASNCKSNGTNLKTRAVTFTADANDVFTYKTCDSSFAGNGWVGRLACTAYPGSFCTASENGGTAPAPAPGAGTPTPPPTAGSGTTTSDAPALAGPALTIVLGLCLAFAV